MKWLATATGAFGVMVYALIAHQYHPHECSQRVWRRHVRGQAMTDRLREYREQFAALTVQSEKRIAKLKGLQEQVKQAKADQRP